MRMGVETIIPVSSEAQKKAVRKNIGRRLAAIREGSDLKQGGMAQLLGVDQATVCRWERGEWKSRSLPPAQLLAYALLQGCPVSTLTAPVILWEDSTFQARKRTPEEVSRCARVLAALGLVDPIEPQPKGSINQEEALVQELFSLLNKPVVP